MGPARIRESVRRVRFRCAMRASEGFFVPSSRDGDREKFENYKQASRAISTGQLHVLPRFHSRPIDVVVYDGS